MFGFVNGPVARIPFKPVILTRDEGSLRTSITTPAIDAATAAHIQANRSRVGSGVMAITLTNRTNQR